MNFAELKKKALKLKNDMVDISTKKLVESSMVINKIEDLDKFIEKSKTKTFVSSETGETKKFIKKVIIIFAESNSDFMRSALIKLPILITKSFSQNIPLKLCDINIEELAKYHITKTPTLTVFETEKLVTKIENEEKIGKIIKSFSLDINKTIDNLEEY